MTRAWTLEQMLSVAVQKELKRGDKLVLTTQQKNFRVRLEEIFAFAPRARSVGYREPVVMLVTGEGTRFLLCFDAVDRSPVLITSYEDDSEMTILRLEVEE